MLSKLIKRLAMNTLRTLVLILVSTIQITGMISNISLDSLQSTKLSGKICNEVKSSNYFKNSDSGYDLHLTKKDDLKRINNTLNCAESPLISVEKPVVSSYKTDDLPAIKTIENNLQPIKIISGISQITFDGTVSAELF